MQKCDKVRKSEVRKRENKMVEREREFMRMCVYTRTCVCVCVRVCVRGRESEWVLRVEKVCLYLMRCSSVGS